jgi:hypothetical protein
MDVAHRFEKGEPATGKAQSEGKRKFRKKKL